MKLRLAANFGTGRLGCGHQEGPLLFRRARINAIPLRESAMNVLLGAIADDFTGATDLCNTLVRRGMRTVQLIDVPGPGAEVADAEAVVVALKSRTIPPAAAIEKSLAAPAWLQKAGARQSLFQNVSTFHS